MLLALVGVTGVGKTYYKTKIVEALNTAKQYTDSKLSWSII